MSLEVLENIMEKKNLQQLIDKQVVRHRFRNASSTYDAHATVQGEMAYQLVDMAHKYVSNNQNSMLELGCGTGVLTREIIKSFTSNYFIVNDLVQEVFPTVFQIVLNSSMPHSFFLPGDIESIALPDEQDVIWSGATIQWINDLEMFFSYAAEALTEEGFLVVSTFLEHNFQEVKTATDRGISYKTKEELINLVNTKFEVLDMKDWEEQVWFDTPMEVLRHMRYTGVNALTGGTWTRADIREFESKYQAFKGEKGYPLTYHPVLLVLQKKSIYSEDEE